MTSDSDLIEGCKKGSHAAFEALYTKYARRMMAIAKRYCNTSFEAEDVVQEAFIKVFEKVKDFDSKNSFEGWIKRVLINHAINHHRNTSKERWMKDAVEIQVVDENIADVISKMSNDELLELLKKLPFGFQMVFNLYVIEGYNHKEVGEILGISDGTSKSQLARAKLLLKELVVKNSFVSNERE